MARTPEGKVKDDVTKLLRGYKNLYYHMPVQTGYGSPTLDIIGWYRGFAFAIETKAAAKVPTPRQKLTMQIMEEAGAEVFVVTGRGNTEELTKWLNSIV